MEAIFKTLCLRDRRRQRPPDYMGTCWTLTREEEDMYSSAMGILWGLGWVWLDKEEPHPLRTGAWPDRVCKPWLRDPVTGEEVRGVYAAMEIALSRYVEQLASTHNDGVHGHAECA